MSSADRRAVAALAAAVIGVATLTGGGSVGAREATSEPGVGTSLVGSYLAARHAQAVRDYPAAADFLVQALEQAPDEVALMRRAHVALLLDGRFDEAVEIAADIAMAEEEARLARLTLAVAALRDDRPEAAADSLGEISPTSIYRLLKPLTRAWALYGAGRFDDALDALAELPPTGRTAALHHLHAALLHDAHGDAATAEAHFLEAMASEDPPSMRTIDLFGAFLERQGRPQEAAEHYRTFLSDGSRSALIDASLARAEAGETPPPAIADAKTGASEALFNIAGAVSGQPAPETALLLARHAHVLQPDLPALQALTGRLLEALGRLEAANTMYANIDPDSPLAWQLQLRIASNLDDLDQTEAAEAALRELAAERSDDPEPLIILGDMFRRHDRFREAVDVYDSAFERIPAIEPYHWSLLYSRGIALERSKLWDRAEGDFLKALEFEPEQPLVLNYLGYSWIEKGLHLDRALDMVRRAVDQRPNDGYIVDSLGWAYYKLGRYAEAVRELERAVELRPEDPVINDHLGDAYWQVGREREARFQWAAALGLDPDPEVLASLERKLVDGLSEDTSATGAADTEDAQPTPDGDRTD